jgi:hypothetical protein
MPGLPESKKKRYGPPELSSEESIYSELSYDNEIYNYMIISDSTNMKIYQSDLIT